MVILPTAWKFITFNRISHSNQTFFGEMFLCDITIAANKYGCIGVSCVKTFCYDLQCEFSSISNWNPQNKYKWKCETSHSIQTIWINDLARFIADAQ